MADETTTTKTDTLTDTTTTSKEVTPPKEGVSDAVKQAYQEDQKEKSK